VANFKLEDSIMTIEWSPDGQWLYAGGEDFAVTVINATWWEAVHRMKRHRWVQLISSSHGGNHVAVGGVSSEVSILEVDNGWDTAINVSLKGLLPLSAQWHPQDQCLVLTGQNNSVMAVETTNARIVSGHFLRSVSPILAIEFSPDGRMAAIGNEAGILTIFKLSGTIFITNYDLVLDCDGSVSIQWSLNGAFLAIAAGNKLLIIAQTRPTTEPSNDPPNASGFYVAKVVRDLGKVHTVAIDPTSHHVAVSGAKTTILDATSNFERVKEFENAGMTRANSWSPDASWFAIIGEKQS
jgi:WD40 repeat protein